MAGLALLLCLLACANNFEPANSEQGSSSVSQNSNLSASSSSADLLGIAVTPDEKFATLFANQNKGAQVLAQAHVTRLLADDEVGDRHQQFIVALASGQTLKVAHNIDLAQRVPVAVGDEVYLYGEYAYNAEGGVIHWTHQDPDGSHVSGWIWHQGARYQ